MKIGVLALQGDVREHALALERVGPTPIPVKSHDELAAVSGLILPGGESTTIGKLLDRFGLLQPLKERVESGMPLFGTCAGAILMAMRVVGDHGAPQRLEVLDVTVRRNAYGRQVESFEAELNSTQDELRGAFIRAPAFEEIGPEVEVLATLEDRPVLVRQTNLLAATFHPEIVGEVRVHALFAEMVGGAVR